MEEKKPKILLVDDDAAVLNMLEELFQGLYETVLALSGEEAIQETRENHDLCTVVLDIKMPGMDGLTAKREIEKLIPDLPIILHTGHPGDYREKDINALEDPYGYVTKGDSIEQLMRAVKNGVEKYMLLKDNRRLIHIARNSFNIIGESQSMQEVFRMILQVADKSIGVMIYGETGTGKELVAKAIHKSSPRSDNHYGVLNCNHRSSDMVASYLFGHARGAFTGAIDENIGLFGYARGGSILFDDVGDLHEEIQKDLLRVLEENEYTRLGETVPRKTDFRSISASNKSLEQLVENRMFREDLYFRLKGPTITLPPLRERPGDIKDLTEYFAETFAADECLPPRIFSNSAIDALIDYKWPGNVRELKKAVESLVAMSRTGVIEADDVHSYLNTRPLQIAGEKSLREKTDDFMRREIEKALNREGRNVTRAADVLKMDRANLHKLMKRLGIKP